MSRCWILLKIHFKLNRIALLIFVAWFIIGFLIFLLYYKFSSYHSLALTFYFDRGGTPFSMFYEIWGIGVIIQLAGSVIFNNVMSRYNLEECSRMMARELKDHTVVIGYTNLGKRIVDRLKKRNLPFVLIEKNGDLVDDFLRNQEPVVVDDATGYDALKAAGVPKAKNIISAINRIEPNLLISKRVKELNKDSKLVIRCFQDELVEVFEALGVDHVLSSSKTAVDSIFSILKFKK